MEETNLNAHLTQSPEATIFLKTKLLFDITISYAHKRNQSMGPDNKEYFLASPMKGDVFIQIRCEYFSKDIKKRYNL